MLYLFCLSLLVSSLLQINAHSWLGAFWSVVFASAFLLLALWHSIGNYILDKVPDWTRARHN